MNRNLNRWALVTASVAILAFPPPGWSESAPLKKVVMSKPAEAPIAAGVRYDSGNRRDPFLNPLRLKKVAEDLNEELGRGTPPPGISGMFIADVALLGVSSREDGRTAVFRGPDKHAYFLQPGDKLFDGYLKEIGPDFVLLIRETRLKSGKVLTQDVQKRLRTP
jgi:hypothetical protein